MPNHQRDAAIKRLRRAARDVIYSNAGRKVVPAYGNPAWTQGRHDSLLKRLKNAWQEFPECERDEVVPSPEEIIARCDAYDRQKEEQERIAQRINQ